MQTRIIKTCFWDDPKTRKLDKNSKYLLLYFLSNRFVGMSNYYEASLDSVLGDTKLNKKEFDSAVTLLKQLGLADYYQEWVFIPNLEKHNKYKESPKNFPTYSRQLESVPKEVLAYFDKKEDSSIHTTIHSSTILPINNKYININQEDRGVGERNKKTEIKTSRNSLTPCTFEEIGEIAKEMQLNVKDVKTTHDTIMDKIAADEFNYKTVYFTLRNWLRLSIQKGHIKQYSGPVFQRDPRLLEIEKNL